MVTLPDDHVDPAELHRRVLTVLGDPHSTADQLEAAAEQAAAHLSGVPGLAIIAAAARRTAARLRHLPVRYPPRQ